MVQQQLFRCMRRGRSAACHGRVPDRAARKALEAVRDRQVIGKVVLTMGGAPESRDAAVGASGR